MPATELKPKRIRNLGIYGVIRPSEVDEFTVPDEVLTKAINVHFDRKGAVTLRPGLTIIGSQIQDNPILGLYNALFSNSSLNCILAVVSTGAVNGIYKSTGGAFSSSTTDTKDLKTRFTTFADRVIRFNGTDSMKVFNGTDWATTGTPINPDQMTVATKYGEGFKARVYTTGGNANPDRVYYSSVISSSGNITWTPADNFVDIQPNDGENVSGLKRYATQLLVFKPNYIYRLTTTVADPDPLIKVGTRSQESIVDGKDGVYFHHDSGFYKYSGGMPEEISRPISDFVNAVPLSFYQNISGWKDLDHIYWNVGDLIVDGVSFTNIVARYTISSKVWTVYSYATELKWGCDFNDGSTLYQIVGDEVGKVYKLNQGATDNGTAISYDLETKWYELGSVSERKTINDMIAICEKAQGSILMYKIDGGTNWENIGQLRKWLNYFKPNFKFHRIKFRLTGMSSQEAFIFRGIEILRGINEGILE